MAAILARGAAPLSTHPSGDEYRIASHRFEARLASMTRAITVRLDEADHAALQRQADQLRLRPGTLARILVHAGLSGDAPAPRSEAALAALDRLVARSRDRPPADALAMVAAARTGLDPRR